MTVTEEIKSEQLAELIKQVQAGNEVVLTQDRKPVAKIVAASMASVHERGWLKIKSLKGHKVLTPNFTHAEIADEMFGQK